MESTVIPQPRHRLQLSATQLVASALAAVTATVLASYLGVSGTVIGAAVASVVTVIGNAVYSHSLRRTGARVRTAMPATARWSVLVPAVTDAEPAPQSRRHATSLRVLAVACAAVFVMVLLLVTAVEVVAGAPLSDVLRGRYGAGTTVFGSLGQPPASTVSAPSRPSPTVTVTAKVVTTTPTVTVTAPAVIATATPTPTVRGTTATPAPTPTVAPSSTGAPSGTSTPWP